MNMMTVMHRRIMVAAMALALAGCHDHHGTVHTEPNGNIYINVVGIPGFECDGSLEWWEFVPISDDVFDTMCREAETRMRNEDGSPRCTTGAFGVEVSGSGDDMVVDSVETVCDQGIDALPGEGH